MNPKLVRRVEALEAKFDALAATVREAEAAHRAAVEYIGKAEAALQQLGTQAAQSLETMNSLQRAHDDVRASLKAQGDALHLLLTGKPTPPDTPPRPQLAVIEGGKIEEDQK